MTNESISTSNIKSVEQVTQEASALQRNADIYLLSGLFLLGSGGFIFGAVLFVIAMRKLKRMERDGYPVRPHMVTLIAAAMLIDSFGNCLGWSMDFLSNNSWLGRYFMMTWGAFVEGGYFWQYNSMLVGGNSFPGEKAWEAVTVYFMMCIRIAACIGLLSMKRWAFRWMVISCWLGIAWLVGYLANYTIYAEARFSGVLWPVYGIWIFAIPYCYPMVVLPWLYTVNKEIFTD